MTDHSEDPQRARLTRALRLETKCNLAIVRAKDEAGFLTEICQLVVETGGYLMAWIGFAEQDAARSVRPVAESGYENGYLQQIRVSWDDATPAGRGPSGTAIRTGQIQVNQRLWADPSMSPWRDAAIQRGYQASIGLPLLYEGQALGVLTIYASEPDAFNSDEVELLEEIARNVAYGMHTLRTKLQRDAALRELQDSEERYRTLVEFAPDAIIVIDERGIIEQCNPAGERFFGYQPGELHGQSADVLMSSPGQGSHASHLARYLKTGEAHIIGVGRDVLAKRKDGSTVTIHLRIGEHILADGSRRFIGLVRDLTERLQAEAALRQRDELFRSIIGASVDGFWITDAKGHILDVNDVYCQLSGYSRQEMLRLRIADLDASESPEETAAHIAQVMSRGGDLFETRHRAKDGHIWPVEISVAYSAEAGGRLIVFSRDIRQRKAAEAELAGHREHLEKLVAARTAELKDAEMRTRMILDSTADGIYGYDKDGRINFANPAACRLLGYSQAELIGRSAHETLHYKHPDGSPYPTSECLLHASLIKGYPVRAEHEVFWHANGQPLHISVAGQPIIRSGEVVGAVISITDISHRIETEAELERARQDAQAANAAKSLFLANMSHEIRTPMNAVLGIAYLLEKSSLPDEARELVAKIRSAGQSLQGIINDVLDYSKIESGRFELDLAPFRLCDVLDNLGSIMSFSAGGKDIELVISPSGRLDEYLIGDALRLEQVLVNLTSNAIKFTEHGHVEVAISRIHSDERQSTLRFTVRDTGIGIAEAQREELFQPFVQADVSTTRRFGGTGLGLTISRELVARMGGEISLASVPGEGSEFGFTLTFERGEQIARTELDMKDLRLLIADDNAIAREALSITAEGLGWQARTVASGEEAVEIAVPGHAPPTEDDVIILDWKMPGLDGLAAARAIHEARKDRPMPIILMVTAYSREELAGKPDTALVDAVLSKPVTPSSLYNAVAQAKWARHGATSSSALARSQRLRGVRLLVVDDSDINREVAQLIFADEGAVVHLVNDGKQAVEWLTNHPDDVDLILMDVQMPVMDGYEATRAIRAMPALANLPVVALTAGAFKSQSEEARAAGMDEYISKPFEVDTAIDLIQRLIGGDAVGRQSAPPAAADAPDDLPGLAVGQGLKVWRETGVYRAYLRKFADSHADAVDRVRAATHEEAGRLLHKLKGAAANLALVDLAACAGELEASLAGGTLASRLLDTFQAAMATALDSIGRYAPPEQPGQSKADVPVAPFPADRARIAALLRQLRAAFAAYNPIAAEPVLEELARTLPERRLAALRAAIADFDSGAGAAEARALASELGITIED